MKYQEERLYNVLKKEKVTRLGNEELGEMLSVSYRTISTNLAILERKGLITRTRFFENSKPIRVIEVI